jgi:hypothetical protein
MDLQKASFSTVLALSRAFALYFQLSTWAWEGSKRYVRQVVQNRAVAGNRFFYDGCREGGRRMTSKTGRNWRVMPSEHEEQKKGDFTPAERQAAGFSRQFAMAMELPFVIVSAIAVGGLIGFFLDRRASYLHYLARWTEKFAT